MGLRVTADIGRNESRSDALAGMGNIHPRPRRSAFFNFFPTAADLPTSRCATAPATTTTGADRPRRRLHDAAREQLRGTVGVADHLRQRRLHAGLFRRDAAAVGVERLSPSTASARAWRDVRLNASVVYAIDARWSLTGALTVASLQSGRGTVRSSSSRPG